jgi:hypothetical protein
LRRSTHESESLLAFAFSIEFALGIGALFARSHNTFITNEGEPFFAFTVSTQSSLDHIGMGTVCGGLGFLAKIVLLIYNETFLANAFTSGISEGVSIRAAR